MTALDNLPVEAAITYECKDGWHLFTCDQLKGLFVASRDRRKAFDDVPVALRGLLKLDYDVECSVRWTLTYAGFLRELRLFDQSSLAERAKAVVKERTQELVDGGFPVMVGSYLDHRLSA